ncbi:MAG TPA: sigma 54-interacting transcriptional regulator [Terriglobales bacterium]|nr:sigma 54-interacting transcriptional regulator [Terriglobales bacterium]
METKDALTEHPLQDADEGAVLRQILEGTAKETGESFFAALVENLAKALGMQGAWVTIWHGESRLRAVAFWLGESLVPNYEYDLAGTPCEPVFRERRWVHIQDRLVDLYPNDPDLRPMGAVSYMGVPLLDVDGRILGHLAVLDTRPMPEEPRLLALFQIFAARAAAELQRLRAEEQLREREEKLRRLFDSVMDAIVEFGPDLAITRLNPAAELAFGGRAAEIVGAKFADLLSRKSCEKIIALMHDLDRDRDRRRSLWVTGGLEAVPMKGRVFPAEATLSRFEIERRAYYTVIFRNVNDRFEAEKKINTLTAEAEYLRQAVKTLGGFDQIIGESAALREVLHDIEQVAGTDTTVLILGETGTGKELVARAIHAASRRRDKPLITINCAAIPATLMESEFFGHEKGAFTGATQKREGRFALADCGTIFLDEIGELSLDLQAKILRVLQEGEFAPVGSSQTKKVDVRIIAATNRDLKQAVKDGHFRDDLYYRLNVFPVAVPPLRERSDDVVLLASAFAAKVGQRLGRKIEPLSDACKRRLMAYAWPGNVRELQNVIERAVITAREGRLNFDRALPDTVGETTREVSHTEETNQEVSKKILRICDLQQLERENILRALESTAWRVAGKDGAAALLGMNPSTLNSRIRALRIERPRSIL